MKIKLAAVVLLVLSNTSWSQETCQTIEDCQSIARDRNLSYLPRLLEDKKNLCQFSSSESCEADVVLGANEILLCRTSEKRRQEISDWDHKQFKSFHKDYGAAVVPQNIQNIFSRLTAAAEAVGKKQFPWTLTAYNANFINAHAGADSQVMASAGLWSKDFEEEEIAAVLAHETAHIIKEHSLELGCLALEWTGPELNIKEAMEYFREDFSVTSERGQDWSKTSNKIEFEADAIATQILLKAGMDPYAMAKALQKLKPKDGGGFSSGSHPEFDARIEAALRHAEETLKSF